MSLLPIGNVQLNFIHVTFVEINYNFGWEYFLSFVRDNIPDSGGFAVYRRYFETLESKYDKKKLKKKRADSVSYSGRRMPQSCIWHLTLRDISITHAPSESITFALYVPSHVRNDRGNAAIATAAIGSRSWEYWTFRDFFFFVKWKKKSILLQFMDDKEDEFWFVFACRSAWRPGVAGRGGVVYEGAWEALSLSRSRTAHIR